MARSKLKQPMRFLSSYGLTIVMLFLLMVLTIAGTLEQRTIGLYRSQIKYFNSLVLWWDVGIPIPLPGAFLVFVVLTVNLVSSLLVRFRWKLKNTGLIVCHLGLLMLMCGSFVTYLLKDDGALSFFEGETGSDFVSYHAYQLKVIDASAPSHDVVIEFPGSYLQQGERLVHTENAGVMPFELRLDALHGNCEAIERSPEIPAARMLLGRGSHGIKPVAMLPENERNRPGAEVSIWLPGAAEPLARGALLSDVPGFVEVEGRQFRVLYERRAFPLPFSVRLLSTRKEVHPGTTMPRHFESRVIVRDGGNEREVLIRMNEPLRYRGFTFFQSGFDELPRGKVSTLAVVRDPGELIPYISCALVFLGMCAHFLVKLISFLRKRSRRASS